MLSPACLCTTQTQTEAACDWRLPSRRLSKRLNASQGGKNDQPKGLPAASLRRSGTWREATAQHCRRAPRMLEDLGFTESSAQALCAEIYGYGALSRETLNLKVQWGMGT